MTQAAPSLPADDLTPFTHTLHKHKLALPRTSLAILQINIGKLCDLACRHCHAMSKPAQDAPKS